MSDDNINLSNIANVMVGNLVKPQEKDNRVVLVASLITIRYIIEKYKHFDKFKVEKPNFFYQYRFVALEQKQIKKFCLERTVTFTILESVIMTFLKQILNYPQICSMKNENTCTTSEVNHVFKLKYEMNFNCQVTF